MHDLWDYFRISNLNLKTKNPFKGFFVDMGIIIAILYLPSVTRKGVPAEKTQGKPWVFSWSDILRLRNNVFIEILTHVSIL